jgi:hypothetical protein
MKQSTKDTIIVTIILIIALLGDALDNLLLNLLN